MAGETAGVSTRRLETRARLLDAASEVFAEFGLQGASVERICARADFTRGAFYSNFSSKEELFIAMLEREFERQGELLAEKANELEPELRECETPFTAEEAAEYVIDFIAPSQNHATWFALELELLMLATRDPGLVSGKLNFKDGLYEVIAEPVERIIAAAGRRVTIPVERALPVLGALYESSLHPAILGGEPLEAHIDSVGERIAELLFAITEPVPA